MPKLLSVFFIWTSIVALDKLVGHFSQHGETGAEGRIMLEQGFSKHIEFGRKLDSSMYHIPT
jgi:hypothetical protein